MEAYRDREQALRAHRELLLAERDLVDVRIEDVGDRAGVRRGLEARIAAVEHTLGIRPPPRRRPRWWWFAIAAGAAAAVALVAVGMERDRQARVRLATSRAAQIRNAAELWLKVGNGSELGPGACPTLEDLLGVQLARPPQSDTLDPWGRPYRIQCSETNIFVSSDGPDGIPGNGDDVMSVSR